MKLETITTINSILLDEKNKKANELKDYKASLEKNMILSGFRNILMMKKNVT